MKIYVILEYELFDKHTYVKAAFKNLVDAEAMLDQCSKRERPYIRIEEVELK